MDFFTEEKADFEFLCDYTLEDNHMVSLGKIFPLYTYIGLDKGEYQVNSFLITRQKHMLWVLIRSEALLMSTHNICFC